MNQKTEMTTFTPKERTIRMACLHHNKRLSAIAERAPVSGSFFYRVVRGIEQSAAVDEFIAQELQIPIQKLKEHNDAKTA